MTRLETLTASLSALYDARMGAAAIAAEVSFAAPTLRKIAASNVDMARATAALRLIVAGKGTFAPLYFLGLKAVPRHGMQWMANVRVARYEIDSAEYLAELAAIVAEKV